MKKNVVFSMMPITLALLAATHGARTQNPGPSPTSQTRPRTVMATPPSPQQPVATPTPQAKPGPSPVSAQPTPVARPQEKASAPGIVPAVPYATFVPAPLGTAIVQPVRPLAVSKVRPRITEAQRLLKTRLRLTALTPSLDFVTIAALDNETSQMHLLTLPKQTFLRAGMETTLASSLGIPLRLRVVRPNYVNTAVIVTNLEGRQLFPLVVEYPIEKFGAFREMAYYTSAHPALLSPEVVKTGQTYVRTMLDLAAKRLKDKGIIVSPQIIDVAERLCVVEHVDHDRFRRESRLALYEEVYALFALNELDTYRFSVSFAGAGGMVQMIPATYQMVRQRHPSVGLNPDFVLGMRNHGNALEAMLLYMRDTWNDLALNSEVDYALKARLATQPELLSAGYNSNPARLPLYLRRGGSSWRTLIPRETQMYLQIYRSFESLVPLKGREAVVSGQ